MSKTISLMLLLAFVTEARAEDAFSRTLSPADFTAAGLGKLTPAELAKLDDLIHTRQRSAAPVAAPAAESPRPDERTSAAPASRPRSLLERAKVLLAPGTEIEYTTLDSTLTEPFKGWQKGTVLGLANGQYWQVVEDGSFWSPTRNGPVRVRIEPGALGSFFLAIEDGGRPKVKLVPHGNAASSR